MFHVSDIYKNNIAVYRKATISWRIPLKIQFLNGGLANQAFQYIFVRYAELSNPGSEPWFFDDSFFYANQIHNGLELEKVFGLKLNLLSRYFDADVWNALIESKRKGISIPQSFHDLGFDIMMITEFENFKEHNPFTGKIYRVPGGQFLPQITEIQAPYVYYHGYWQNSDWLKGFRSIITEELAFPPIVDTKNLEYANRIMSTEAAAIHIRRGDYVTLGWACEENRYYQKISQLLSSHPHMTLFVFSDDILWCRQHAAALGLTLPTETVFIEGNTAGKNYLDLQLMSLCPLMILNRSAFGYLAMLLNNRLKDFLFTFDT